MTFGIGPERARLSGTPDGPAPDVTVVEELGAQRLIHGHEPTVAQNAEEPVASGRIELSFAPEDAFPFDPQTGQRL